MKSLMGAALAAGLALGWAGAAGANDSTAELATGGLVLTRTDAIEMKSEDLYLSPKQVRVTYHFLNTSPADVTVTVAFPMPDITTEGLDSIISLPTQDPVNLLGFSTTVDGKPVVAEVEQKVIKNGVDRTALLNSMGVPLAPHLESTNKAIDKLPKAQLAELERLGLVLDASSSDEIDWQPTWTLKTTYFWRQTFPAGREIVVQHQYQPSLGYTDGNQWGTAGYPSDPVDVKRKAEYCVDPGFVAAARKTAASFDQEYLRYVLVTGANWKAPIGDFRMVIDKGDPGNVISFCGEGVTKISPTQFELRRTNFTPTKDVAVLILVPPPKS